MKRIAEVLRYRVITLLTEDMLKGDKLVEEEVYIPPSNFQWFIGDLG